MSQPVDTGYYPGVVVNLTLRFDEALQVAENPGDFEAAARSGELDRPDVVSSTPNGHSVTVGTITAESYDQSSGGVVRRAIPGRRIVQNRRIGPGYRIPLAGTIDPQTGRITLDSTATDQAVGDGMRTVLKPLTFGGDQFTTVMDVVPLRATFDLPHPRQAATFSMEFNYTDLPIDPRLLRAAGVEIHLGCVDAKEFGAGMVGQTDANGRSRSLLANRSKLVDPQTGRPAVRDSTLLFYGTVDKWEVEHDVNGGSSALLTGRSIVGILLDGKPPADILTKIDLTRPIHRVVADMIATIPTDMRLTLDVQTDEREWPNGRVPAPGSIEGFTNVRIGVKDGQPKAGAGGADKVTYWDLITNLCNLVGGIPYLQGNILWVRPGRSIFEILDKPGRSPFATDREAPDGKLLLRRLTLGSHLTKFKLDRKFGGTPVPIVIAYGLDDRASGTDRIVTGQWPPADSAAAKAKDTSETLRIPIPNLRDKQRLTEIAQSLYEEIGRGEVGGEFESAGLSSFGGDNADPDLLRLRPLEPVEVVVDASNGPTPIVHELTMRARQTFDQEVADLVQSIGDIDAARAIVAARRGAVFGILDAYRVTSVRFEADADKGIRVSGTFQNYIVPRHNERTATPAGRSVIGARAIAHGQDRRRRVRSINRAQRIQRLVVNEIGFGSAVDVRNRLREAERAEQAARKAESSSERLGNPTRGLQRE